MQSKQLKAMMVMKALMMPDSHLLPPRPSNFSNLSFGLAPITKLRQEYASLLCMSGAQQRRKFDGIGKTQDAKPVCLDLLRTQFCLRNWFLNHVGTRLQR
jgi:hypothetical protein